MKLHIATIALDAMPFITWHLPIFNELSLWGVDWTWHVAEGVANNTHCTNWCRKIEPRLSKDGTTEYLESIKPHPNVRVYQREEWDGKVEMFNTICDGLEADGVLLQVDADELWSAASINKILELFSNHTKTSRMMFYCHYYVGWHIRTQIHLNGNQYGNRDGEWERAWRFTRGDRFKTHEPPQLIQQCPDVLMTRDETQRHQLMFDHYAYVTPAQVQFKQDYYGYNFALDSWRQLQRNKVWPIRLGRFMPWVRGNDVNVESV